MVHPCRGFNQGTTACSLACVNATCAERTLAPPTIGGGGQRDKQGVTRREQAIERLPHGIQSRLLRRINSLFIRHFPQASSVWRQARSCRMATCAQVQHGIGAASWRPFFSDAPDISGFRRGRRSALRGRRYRYGVLKPSVGGVAPTYSRLRHQHAAARGAVRFTRGACAIDPVRCRSALRGRRWFSLPPGA